MNTKRILSVMLCMTMVVMSNSRRLKTKSNLEPSPVNGYQLEKGGPTVSLQPIDNSIDDGDGGNDLEALTKDRTFKQENNDEDPEDEEILEEELTEAHQGGRSGHNRHRGHENDVTTFNDLDYSSEIPNKSNDLDLDPDRPWDVYQSQQELLGLIMALTERVQSLQHTMLNVKLQNHYIYKTMKRSYKKCIEGTGSQNTIQSAAQKVSRVSCPREFTENPNTNTCYKFMTERISWRMARERCRVDDSDLVTIETKGEQRWIMQQARQSHETRHCDFWTGASDRKAEGNWRWVGNNNALSYSNWNINEPNNGRSGEHCMQMMWVFNWAWNDADCDLHNACYICETGMVRSDDQN